MAVRADRVSAISAQEHSHMELVLLRIEIVEEGADPVQDVRSLFLSQIAEGHVESDFGSSGFLEIVEICSISRLGPWLDGALVDRFRFVRYYQLQIQIDRVAETLAAGTRSKGVIERKKFRFRIFIPDIAVLAFKGFAESSSFPVDGFEDDFAIVFAETDFDRVDQTLANIGRCLETVDQGKCGLLEIDVEQGFRIR